MPAESPLHGGTANRGLVVRVGDTVRRPLRSTSAATHALLAHLHDVGFDGAPRFLGVDSRQREVLTFIPGEAVTPPYPSWALTDSALDSVASLLRRYHAAVADFDWSPYSWPASPPPPYGGEIVSHNDTNLDNVVFREGRAVALIDFDLASPGCRLWDVAATARLWSPLRSPDDVSDARRGHELRRFSVFVAAYGPDDWGAAELVEAVGVNHDWLYAVVRAGGEAGNEGLADYWYQASARIVRTRRWLAESRQVLTDALTAAFAPEAGETGAQK